MIYYKKVVLGVLLLFTMCEIVWAQSDSLQIYRQSELQKLGIPYYNLSKSDKFNFEVVVIGGVKQPGIYLLPEGTTVIELVALTGGVSDESILNNIKLIRAKTKNPEIKADTVITISYSDFFDKEKIGSISKRNPLLKPGDIITFPIKPDKDFWQTAQNLTTIFILPLLAAATLIVTILTYSK